jgi:hypothetical protein
MFWLFAPKLSILFTDVYLGILQLQIMMFMCGEFMAYEAMA